MKRPTYLIIFEWICVIIGILGMLLTADKHPTEGFVISSVASLLFIVYNYLTKQYGLMFMSFLYLVIEVYGILKWSGNL